jgi:hypothetical protein
MRIVKHAIGAFCLLSALLLAGLWVRSYWVGDVLRRSWYAAEGEYYVRHSQYWLSAYGQLVWQRARTGRGGTLGEWQLKLDGPEVPLSHMRLEPPARTEKPWFGFDYEAIDDLSGAPDQVWGHWLIAIPIWLPFLIFAAPAGWWLRGVLRRRRGAHECPSCGYDLRATPDRCPECGMTAG